MFNIVTNKIAIERHQMLENDCENFQTISLYFIHDNRQNKK